MSMMEDSYYMAEVIRHVVKIDGSDDAVEVSKEFDSLCDNLEQFMRDKYGNIARRRINEVAANQRDLSVQAQGGL